MIKIFKKIRTLLTPAEQWEALRVLGLTVLMAFFELGGIASILPFMVVLGSPRIVKTNGHFRRLYEFFGFESVKHFLFFLGVFVLFILILGNAVKALTRWKSITFGVMIGHTLSTRLFTQFLYQPYAFFLTRNSSKLGKNILGEVNALVTQMIMPFSDIVSRSVVIIAILGLLMIADPILALSSAIILGGAFGVVYFFLRKWLLITGAQRAEAQRQRYQAVNEAFLGIKNVKLTGNEKTYQELYEAPSYIFARTTALNGVAGEMPRYAMEVIAFGGTLFIILYLLLQDQGLSNALPLITLYAFAGYRMMPSFQSIFQSFTKVRFYSAALDQIQKELTDTVLDPQVMKEIENPVPPLPFEKQIEFRDICFQYDQSHKPVLQNLNFVLQKNTSLGIVGKTGAGKTTVVDLLLGLLSPTRGEILVDGVVLNDQTRRAWQKNCAYVTQHIYLTDNTIRANIAFGVPNALIDEEMVMRAAKMAALDGFIESELAEGYDTVIGENGVRLSGGQRQRIGLARALYLDRPILVLDEATSALDNETESEVMSAINGLSHQKTIVMIAHRLNSLEYADNFLRLGSD